MSKMTLTHCHECDRGRRGNAEHKCACGWKVTQPCDLGCYLGTPIVGTPVEMPKRTRAQERYQRFLRSDGAFDSFLHFLRYDAAKGGAR